MPLEATDGKIRILPFGFVKKRMDLQIITNNPNYWVELYFLKRKELFKLTWN
jgi:hypothetical protein